MIRSVAALALFVTLLSSGRIHAESDRLVDSHLRSTCPQMVDAIAAATGASSTFRGLVDRLEASDVIVYVVARPSRFSGVAGHVAFIGAGGGRRYLRVAIDPKFGGLQLIGLLGHELRHAVEIAEEPSVVDERSLAILYRRIGFSEGERGMDRYDTANAIETGGRVMRDVMRRTN